MTPTVVAASWRPRLTASSDWSPNSCSTTKCSRTSPQKVVTPAQQRVAVDHLQGKFRVSQRRAIRVLGRPRSTLRYRRKQHPNEPALVREIQRLARRHPRYGDRRIHALLARGGWSANLKRVRRLWGELGLKRPIRLKNRGNWDRSQGREPMAARFGRLSSRTICGHVTLFMTGRRMDVRSSGWAWWTNTRESAWRCTRRHRSAERKCDGSSPG